MGLDKRDQSMSGQSSQVMNLELCWYLNKTERLRVDKRGKDTGSHINTVSHLQLVSPVEPPTYSVPISPSTCHRHAAIFPLPLPMGLCFPKLQTQQREIQERQELLLIHNPTCNFLLHLKTSISSTFMGDVNVCPILTALVLVLESKADHLGQRKVIL